MSSSLQEREVREEPADESSRLPSVMIQRLAGSKLRKLVEGKLYPVDLSIESAVAVRNIPERETGIRDQTKPEDVETRRGPVDPLAVPLTHRLFVERVERVDFGMCLHDLSFHRYR